MDNLAQDPAHELSRFEKMTNVTVWTNRLDKRLKSRLDSLKLLLLRLNLELVELETEYATDASAEAAIAALREQTDRWFKEVFPELVELCVVASDHVYMLDSAARSLSKQLSIAQEAQAKLKDLVEQLERSQAYKLGRLLLRPLRAIKTLAVDPDKSAFTHTAHNLVSNSEPSPAQLDIDASSRTLCFDFGQGVREDPHAAVDNSSTALSIFSDWVSIYHFNGRYYGSKKPCIDDHMPHLVDLHERISFTGKRILEIGPFEAAHTKQMLDLGAAHITAIEANQSAYLKCLIVKSEFDLSDADFIFGDCNKILRRPEFRAKTYDFCLASGVLYHMEDPLSFLDLVLPFAPIVFVWTQVASEQSPSGEWTHLEDSDGRRYRGRINEYKTKDHWGGVAGRAVWLKEDDLFRAFADRGFALENVTEGTNAAGAVVSFIARLKPTAAGQIQG